MIIKCPQCSTGYNIPEKLVADKPRKMRCTRCQNVFTIARRQQQAPRGYEEFTGKQHLPDEFAFLKEATEPPQQPAEPPVERPPEGLYDSVAGRAAEQPDTIPLEPPVVSPPTQEPAQPPTVPEPEPAAPEPTPEAAPAAPSAPRQEPASAAQRPSGASDIYDTTSSWELEAPLELGGYAIEDETPPAGTGQAVGKVMTAIIILVVVFLVFVAWRNDWSISFTDLPGQIGFAFSGESSDPIPDEAQDIEATIGERHIVIADDKTTYLVVDGTVFNAASTGRSEVVLRGSLIDLASEQRAETRGPCGKVIEDLAIKLTAKGAIGGHFRQSGSLYNCKIKPDGSTVFQLIFEDPPLDYNADFTVEVTAVSAIASTPG